MVQINLFNILLIAFGLTYVNGEGSDPFKHPGVIVSNAQLEFVKTKAEAKSEPWEAAYKKMMSSNFASLSYEAKPRKMVECGSSSNPNYGCTDERENAIAAYTHALIWFYTGNQTHANKAIEIMDAWATTITGHNNSNAPLQTGWAGAVWPRAGEIIHHSPAGWASDKRTRFENMLKNAYLPEVRKGAADKNGNWELVMIEATGNIAVFLDDHDTFNHALSMWRKRVPAYIYLKSDGDHPVAPPGSSKTSKAQIIEYWQGQETFVDGIAQETCRDFEHTTWGIGAAINFAETAYHQGVDLYKEGHDRIVKTMEFHATYLLGASIPSWLCDGKLSLGSRPMWEIGYNHYHNIVGTDMPKSKEYIAKIRPTGAEYFLVWESLTHEENTS